MVIASLNLDSNFVHSPFKTKSPCHPLPLLAIAPSYAFIATIFAYLLTPAAHINIGQPGMADDIFNSIVLPRSVHSLYDIEKHTSTFTHYY